MMRWTSFVPLFLIFAPAPAAAAPGNTIFLTGQDDALLDRPAIQAAIDAVPKNGTVRLEGTFQLDGVEIFVRRGFLTIEGVALDNDGDHRVNEDWADGEDNDLDGAVDEDDFEAVLKGVLDGGGLPDDVGDGTFPPGRGLFNRGFAVQGGESVVIRDLKFTGMARGVAFAGDVDVQPGLYCDDMVTTNVAPKNSVAERNVFDNTIRGVQVFGSASNIRFRDNIVINAGRAAILVVGDAIACWNSDETASAFPIGRPAGTQVVGNTVAHRPGLVIQIVAADSTMFHDNTTEDVGVGLYVENSPRTQVLGNRLMKNRNHVAVWVIDAAPGTSAGSLFQNNVLEPRNNGWEGVSLEGDATGVKVSNNTVLSDASYFLGPDTRDNTVILLQGQTVTDLGTDNRVIGGGS